MVSGNGAIPDFNSLSEAEQRVVAERLLKLQDSGWKPFWCRDSNCSGDPHQLVDADGMGLWVDQSDDEGPHGEPVGDVVVFESDGARLRPVLDPNWAHNHARTDQRLPYWGKPWKLFIMSGRGSGKTTTGTEFVTLSARRGLDGAIVGRRGTELVNTHVATIIARAHPDFKPTHWASKDILEWPEVEVLLPNGKKERRKPITYLFSAEKPENIRSVNLSYAWVDEAAFMDEIETVWMNLELATRIEMPGNPIHFLITSTPTSTEWVMEMEDDPDVEIRRVSTYANFKNLSKSYIDALRKKYEGTRMGRQELHGEVLRDVEGAMWNDEMFIHRRIEDPVEFLEFIADLDDRVLAVDPAGSKGKRSDSHGIIAAGAAHFDEDNEPLPVSRFYVLGRATIKGSPTEMAERTFRAARLFRVNRIIVEKNFGGEHVRTTLQQYAKLNPLTTCDENGEEYQIVLEHAAESKETRAEPTVAKYEQGRVEHVINPTAYGDLSELEKQQVNWIPPSRGGRQKSPNDIDALVWAIRALESKVRYVAQQATSREVLSKLKRGRRAS